MLQNYADDNSKDKITEEKQESKNKIDDESSN